MRVYYCVCLGGDYLLGYIQGQEWAVRVDDDDEGLSYQHNHIFQDHLPHIVHVVLLYHNLTSYVNVDQMAGKTVLGHMC